MAILQSIFMQSEVIFFFLSWEKILHYLNNDRRYTFS